ncbi:hypothetical protein K8I61_17955 [bacterium]|nr:hypothetical protein [bacterium]
MALSAAPALAQTTPPPEGGPPPAPGSGTEGGPVEGGVITPSKIYGTTIQKISMAIPEFFAESETGFDDLSHKLADLLTEDMEMSGEFEVADRARYLEDPRSAGVKPGSFSFSDWKIIGVEYLIKGSYKRAGESLTITARLYNVGTESLVMGKEYSGKADDYYRMIHLFANEVLLSLFGNKGFFGSRLAYVSGTKNQREVYVVDLDGRNRRRLTNLGVLAMTPRWSPDGKSIVFAASSDVTQPSLYIVDVESGKAKKIYGIDQGVVLTPDFSPSGTRIAAGISLGVSTDVYEMDVNGGNLKNLTKNWSIDLYPTYSPDGQNMLFVSDRPGSPQVYRMGADGSNPVRISFFGGYNQSPAWSPKGNKIAYAAREYWHYTIYVIDEYGGEPYALTADMKPNCEYPSFSPDGRALVFSCETDTGRALFIRTVNDTFTKPITKGTSFDASPDWSPLPED